ncbi:MAG: hypothetical protein ACKO85_11265, partial [Isosphaeraceae bacterium]
MNQHQGSPSGKPASQPSVEPFELDEDQWLEEGLFARDSDGQLLRMDKATLDELDTIVSVKIDGREIEVPKAVPKTDSMGNILRDDNGQIIPRSTTIYDAVALAYAGRSTELSAVSGAYRLSDASAEISISGLSAEIAAIGASGEFPAIDKSQEFFSQSNFGHSALSNPVPILCHREHQDPVAVCRVCVVQ